MTPFFKASPETSLACPQGLFFSSENDRNSAVVARNLAVEARNSAVAARNSAVVDHEVVAVTAAQTLPSHAPGVRMTVVKLTPSKDLIKGPGQGPARPMGPGLAQALSHVGVVFLKYFRNTMLLFQ